MNINQNQALLGLLSFFILVLLSVYFIEFFLKIPPCSLCSYQRAPYIIASVFLLLFFFKKINFKKLIIILAVLSLINIFLSFYHVGIEQGFFNELSVCKNIIGGDNAQDLLKNFQKKGISSCKDVPFAIFGFSLATINLVVNLFLMLFYWKIVKYEKKN